MILAPQLGLFFWSTLLFLVFFFILRKFAWKPILSALKDREESITDSLNKAQEARDQMDKLKGDNEALLKEARAERDKIIKEATALRDQIVSDAKNAAAEAGAKERDKAKQQIDAEKRAALAEIKDTAAVIAVEVAEKILRKQFQDKTSQEDYAKELISDLNNN